MANTPAAEEKKVSPHVSIEGLEEGTPQYKHALKLIREEKKRQKNAVVVEQWTEVHIDNRHKKGGKCLLLKQMKSGNVHSFYLGRYKNGGKDAVDAFAKKGVKQRQPKME